VLSKAIGGRRVFRNILVKFCVVWMRMGSEARVGKRKERRA